MLILHSNDVGPAFRLTKAVDNQRVVVSKGTIHQLIASYDFMVHATGEYVFWLHAYGTSTADNAVRFQIDNLDYIPWHTTYSSTGNRPIWTHYLYEVSAVYFIWKDST